MDNSTLKYRHKSGTFSKVVLDSEWYVDPKDGLLYIKGAKPTTWLRSDQRCKTVAWWKFWAKQVWEDCSHNYHFGGDDYGFISELDLIEIESCHTETEGTTEPSE